MLDLLLLPVAGERWHRACTHAFMVATMVGWSVVCYYYPCDPCHEKHLSFEMRRAAVGSMANTGRERGQFLTDCNFAEKSWLLHYKTRHYFLGNSLQRYKNYNWLQLTAWKYKNRIYVLFNLISISINDSNFGIWTNYFQIFQKHRSIGGFRALQFIQLSTCEHS